VGCVPGGYHLVVARFEPENHVLEAVEGYRRSSQQQPLVVVGDAPYSQDYIHQVRQAAAGDARIRLLGSVYDAQLLDQLYAHAATYVHGHSVGGTNPSLLRAMGAGAAVLAFDVEFNREVTAGEALFWSGPDDLGAIFTAIADGAHEGDLSRYRTLGRQRIAEHYQWEDVVDRYEALMQRLQARRR
jgi:glycosyltransferase involved in cell wall biosynthesis